jgi:hypothetical protein
MSLDIARRLVRYPPGADSPSCQQASGIDRSWPNADRVLQRAQGEKTDTAPRKAEVVVSSGVNERDGGSLYNTQLLFDADGTLIPWHMAAAHRTLSIS